MPNILFASNSISHFPGTTLSNEQWSYSSNRVPYSIFTAPNTIASSPKFKATTTDEVWVHFKMGATVWSEFSSYNMCSILDEDGSTICRLNLHNRSYNGYYLYLNTEDQTDTVNKYLPVQNSQTRTVDLRISYTNLEAIAEFYLNEILVLRTTLSVTSKRTPRYIHIGGHAAGSYYSEIIVADGDTRNARMNLLRPIAAGAYDQWDGNLSSLADDDPTTGLTTTLPDQKQTTVMSLYTGANNISNIVQVSTSVRGENSPTKLRHIIRMGGVDYFSTPYDLPFNKDFQVTDWQLNPATSLPWLYSDLSNLEFGFESIA